MAAMDVAAIKCRSVQKRLGIVNDKTEIAFETRGAIAAPAAIGSENYLRVGQIVALLEA